MQDPSSVKLEIVRKHRTFIIGKESEDELSSIPFKVKTLVLVLAQCSGPALIFEEVPSHSYFRHQMLLKSFVSLLSNKRQEKTLESRYQ